MTTPEEWGELYDILCKLRETGARAKNKLPAQFAILAGPRVADMMKSRGDTERYSLMVSYPFSYNRLKQALINLGYDNGEL
jgi:hypothetical protein